MDIVTYSEAKALGLKTYFTGIPCAKGHIARRLVRNSGCYGCRSDASRRRRGLDALVYKSREERKAYRESEEAAEKKREYRRKYDLEYRKLLKEKVRQQEKTRRHRAENPELYRGYNVKRREAILQRTPSWLTKEHYAQMSLFYKEAAERSKATGVPHVVDHIVPFLGKNVSGLHVPWNLQVLTAKDNLTKSNLLLEEAPHQNKSATEKI